MYAQITKRVHKYFKLSTNIFSEPTVNSLASYTLLKEELRQQDTDFLKTMKGINVRIEFSQNYLLKQQKLFGTLTCHYCNKPNLQIQFDKKIAPSIMATIDHVIPISKGGAIFDENNLVVACSICNTKKGNKIIVAT